MVHFPVTEQELIVRRFYSLLPVHSLVLSGVEKKSLRFPHTTCSTFSLRILLPQRIICQTGCFLLSLLPELTLYACLFAFTLSLPLSLFLPSPSQTSWSLRKIQSEWLSDLEEEERAVRIHSVVLWTFLRSFSRCLESQSLVSSFLFSTHTFLSCFFFLLFFLSKSLMCV